MKPEHVEQMESGGMMCRHCGGRVDEEGYSMGGEMEEGPEESSSEVEEDESEQHEAVERMRAAAFANAVKNRRGE